MAGKRGATSELNDRNWDQEEEPEEPGVFVQADSKTLENRVIKRAKRRGTGEDGAKTSAFSGFGGLTGPSTKANTFPGFKLTPGITGFGGGLQTTKPTNSSVGSSGLFSGASSSAAPFNGNQDSGSKAEIHLDKGQGDWKDSPTYFSFLKSLNHSVLAWIKQHVEENPYIILTPIFKDYERYLQNHKTEASASTVEHSPSAEKEISKTEDSESATLPAAGQAKNNGSPANTFTAQSLTKDVISASDKAEMTKDSTVAGVQGSDVSKGFTFGTTSLSSTGGGFSFGSSTKTTTASSTPSTLGKPGFSFGATSTSTQSSGFSFGTSAAATGKPLFSFGTTSTAAATPGFFGVAASQAAASNAEASNGKNDEEEYVPPVPEVREIKEDDALYSKRCKLYFQRGEQWVDKGVGNIHLKPVAESKTQLLIRADTNLGNILLNVMLSASMPVSRQGKNNVLVVCVPNPPLDSKADESTNEKPVPMLVRVKTGDDADELFGKIEERKALLE
ncbi:nuclear pore complex protein nup50 [Plakobranchus ocellatus]|uniref:Nuclear pore complex protein nup50 n=1 Tax=Plakobranchus ocellatus TaxID=259542 RepID=A0AAV4A3Y0_9GAST|nr:nuclear pore complex protein nup50 [Plakobranchus ocellatus]